MGLANGVPCAMSSASPSARVAVDVDQDHLGEELALHEGERGGRPHEPAPYYGNFAIVDHMQLLISSPARDPCGAAAPAWHKAYNPFPTQYLVALNPGGLDGVDGGAQPLGRQHERHAHVALARRPEARARRHHDARTLHELLAERHRIRAPAG